MIELSKSEVEAIIESIDEKRTLATINVDDLNKQANEVLN